MITAGLTPEAATLGLGVGLVLALVCYLTTNLSPGGMITPGWLALVLMLDYRQVLIIVATAGATFGLTLLLHKVVLLYGKRLFASVVLLGVLIQISVFLLVQQDFPYLFTHQTLGFIVPGLVAYQLKRQPPLTTMLATTAVTGATYAVMISGVLAGVVPAT